MFFLRHGAGKYPPRLRCKISSEQIFRGRKRQNFLLAATTETRRQMQNVRKMAQVVSEQNQWQGRGHKLSEIMRLLPQHSLADWPSILERLGGKDGFMIEGLYLLFTFDPLHNLHFRVSRLLKSCFIQ